MSTGDPDIFAAGDVVEVKDFVTTQWSLIPLGQLRSRLKELPRDREINVICRSGGRAYYATRILLQNGFKVKNISGGMLSLTHNYLFDSEKREE